MVSLHFCHRLYHLTAPLGNLASRPLSRADSPFLYLHRPKICAASFAEITCITACSELQYRPRRKAKRFPSSSDEHSPETRQEAFWTILIVTGGADVSGSIGDNSGKENKIPIISVLNFGCLNQCTAKTSEKSSRVLCTKFSLSLPKSTISVLFYSRFKLDISASNSCFLS